MSVTTGHIKPTTRRSGRNVSTGVIATYSAPSAGMAYMSLIVALYLMKYATDVLGLAPATMGIILGVALIWHAVGGLIAGHLSDRTASRLGRRRPWILAAAVPTAISFTLMWAPPESLDTVELTIWMGVTTVVFYTAQTIYNVPHLALGAELGTGSLERNRVYGGRHILASMGCVLALGTVTAVTMATDPRGMSFDLAVVASVITAALLIFGALWTTERPTFTSGPRLSARDTFRSVFRNRPGRWVLGGLFVQNLGLAAMVALTPYIAEYVVGTPQYTSLFLLCFLGSSALVIPIWLPLANRFGKCTLWAVALGVLSLAFSATPFIEQGSVVLFCIVAAVMGVGAGCCAMVVPSIQADVVDADVTDGEVPKTGAYFSANVMIVGAASGLSLAVCGIVLQLAGFEPNQVQSNSAHLVLKVLYGVFPAVCCLAAALLVSRIQMSGTSSAETTPVESVTDEAHHGAR
jgi:GPH family glycoside/pentoside/hexuronide:cation symporter